ncbi:MAG: mandelate racemase/muconate lactonizing enzyme family protein [Chloroflexota bacterium]
MSQTPSKITNVTAFALKIPYEFDLLNQAFQHRSDLCVVKIETQSGVVGWGMTGITQATVIERIINNVTKPLLIGTDALATEKIWEQLYWQLSPRGQTGYASHAIAAIDVALWDIKGKLWGQPVWKLLGGARDTVPVYATFGLETFNREQLASAALLWFEQGFTRLKMKVGHNGLRRRDEPRPLAEVIVEDVKRVQAVREAVGDEIELYIDANCNLDFYHAVELCRALEPYNIAFFEEPITQNDVRQLADLRQQTSIRLACGQNEGLAFRFRDFLVQQAVDVLQPNVVITGGYSQCAKIAGMAAAFNVPICNGGAWPFHNMHLQGGLSNGWLVEWHFTAVLVCQQLYQNLPTPKNGYLKLPTTPGLGFAPDEARVAEFS